MTNATFNCVTECTHGASACGQPFWSLRLVNEGRIITTSDSHDEVIFAQRGITYSIAATSAVISIPDRAENNNTLISCGAFVFGSTEFSEAVGLIIIGKSE